MDDYIRGNLDKFNIEEPPDGHFERFAEKLGGLTLRRTQPWLMALRIAAIVLLGVVVSYAAVREFNLFRLNSNKLYYGVSSGPEFNEAIQYYTAQLNISYNKIKNLRFDNDPKEKQMVLKELSDMDKQVLVMEKDLKQNPDDERVVHAIINFYQVKIEMMEMIITRTQQSSSSIL